MSLKLNNIIFVKKAKKIHGEFFDYSRVNYEGTLIKVEIGCPEHGYFLQTPNSHLRGRRCPKCYGNIKYNNDTFIEKCEEIWGKELYEKYDLSLVDYKGNKNPIIIFCKKHGIFKQKPNEFLHKHGCKICGGTYISNTNEFVSKANIVHNFKFDYSKSVYKNAHTKLIIKCEYHGDFLQKPYSHLDGCGCPICKSSKGEIRIKNFLDNNKIEYEYNFSFKKCKYKYSLPFDFYIKDKNICIEYDGIQHENIIEYFGGVEKYKERLIRDNIKNDFCKNENINLLRISYKNVNNVEKILKTVF
jgi:very-short-patch-repair endonuclease